MFQTLSRRVWSRCGCGLLQTFGRRERGATASQPPRPGRKFCPPSPQPRHPNKRVRTRPGAREGGAACLPTTPPLAIKIAGQQPEWTKGGVGGGGVAREAALEVDVGPGSRLQAEATEGHEEDRLAWLTAPTTPLAPRPWRLPLPGRSKEAGEAGRLRRRRPGRPGQQALRPSP